MKKKKFDCVEMMHRAGRQIDRELRGLTVEQQIAYWRKKSEEFARIHAARVKAAKSKHAA
jgi:hypothetical protein